MQAAVVEAALSISLMVLSSAAIAAIAYDGTGGAGTYIRQADAAYDLFSIMQHNSTYSSCIYGMGQCSERFLNEFAGIYGLSYMRVSAAGSEMSEGNSSKCTASYSFCEPIALEGYRIMCSYTCT